MSNTPNSDHREQAADLILLDPEDGTHLEFCSDLINENGSMIFEVGNLERRRRWRITLSISEI